MAVQQLLVPSPDKPQAPPPSDHPFWDNFVNAVANRLLGAEQFRRHLRDTLGLPSLLHLKTEDIDKAVKEARPTEGWGGLAGDIAATAPAALIPGGPIASGVAAGVGTALTEPVQGENYWGTKAVQAAEGGALGLATGILGKLLGEAAKRAPGEFNRDVLNAAVPAGAKVTKIGHEGIEQAQKIWDDAYAAVAPKLKLSVDDQLVSDFAKIEASMAGEGATAADIKAFSNIINAQVIEPGVKAELTGEGVQHIQSKLGQLSRSKKDIGPFLAEARSAVLDAAERASPEAAQELAALREKYPAFLAVQRAASSSASDSGVFTPNQLATAARAVDTSKNKAASAAGMAPFQEMVDKAREAHVGEPTTVEKLTQGAWFVGPATRLAQENPIVRQVGRGLEAATVPTVGAVAPLIERGASPPSDTSAGPDTSGGMDMTPGGEPPQMPDMDEFLRGYMRPQSTSEMDQFLSPYLKASHIDQITGAIEQQESGGRNLISPAGARGPMQMMPETFQRYSRVGENIDNPEHNRVVGRRMVADLYDKYGGDPRKIAAAYFSGQPNYRSLKSDVTGKNVASYVADVMGRLGQA